MAARKEQFTGCLLGQALGDAIGFNVEGHGPANAERYVTGIMRAGRVLDYGRDPFSFGQYTDDTQLARELARSLVAQEGQFNPADYAERIATLFRKGQVVGEGLATKRAAQRLISGQEWHEAGDPPPNAGNGTAMRAAPVGLLYWDDPAQMVKIAYKQSRITHQDGRCAAGATVIAGAVALAIEADGHPLDMVRFVAQLAEWAMAHSMLLAEGLEKVRTTWLSLEPAQAQPPIARYGVEQETGWDGISPYVISSVLWSMYAFLRTPDDYFETVATAILGGGDTDTTAAMAGAISGAYNGIEALPHELATRVNDRNGWGYTQLIDLGEQLHALAGSNGGLV
jgi:ADP-ribosylglycohydrolase